jgi:NAD(P) transhydrogenase subunit alpha
MKLGIPKETYPGERRVASVPANVSQFTRADWEVLVESGAGDAAGFLDKHYGHQGARVVFDRDEVFAADVVLQVRALGANPNAGRGDLGRMKSGQTLIGMCDPLGAPGAVREAAETGATLFALELLPRITRAQSMDVLSSMATVAGYRAVLLAASELPKMFPLLMTAAGTLTAVRVLVIGAGVAGLQAIATARRLGAVVRAYDVRPACREQVESLGAKFVDLQLEAGESEDAGGYAKSMDEQFYQRQRELLGRVVAESDAVITTAAVPGKLAPRLITASAVERMAPGSVIVDLAAERGGNCERTKADDRVLHHGVTILGPTNLPSEAAYHASQMYSSNVAKFLFNLVKDGELALNLADEIVRDTLVAHEGDVCNEQLREMLGMRPLAAPSSARETADEEAPSVDQEGGEAEAPEAESGGQSEAN